MASESTKSRTTNAPNWLLIAGCGLLSTLALCVAPAAGAAEHTQSFDSIRKTNRALLFRLRGVEANSVVQAQADLRAGKRHRARRVNVDRVRSAVTDRHLLRIARPESVDDGRLTLRLDDASGGGPAGPPADCAGVDPATLTAPGCNVLREDTSAVSDPEAGLWGNIECATDSRYQYVAAGGDPNASASGASQGNDAYRKLTALDGDNFWGERCELGRNTSLYGQNAGGGSKGTFELYKSGDRRITFFSERYPQNFSMSTNLWQTVMQMKQAQPADNAGGGPVLELQLWGNQLRLQNSWDNAWTTSAPASGKWIRYALDVVYSPDPAVGSVRVFVDLNGDGDALDAGEQSPAVHMQTLLVESDGPNGISDGLAPGDAIPDHLRLGIYHSPSISCPPPAGCSVDVDNVQIAG